MKTVFYTGKGDKGSSYLGKKKLSKDDSLFHVLGTLDELNSLIGWTRAFSKTKKTYMIIYKSLLEIQENLFIAQAEVASIGMGFAPKIKITEEKTVSIEKEIKNIDNKVPILKNFIIPGGSELSSRIDIARAVSRRLERTLVAFSKKKKISPHLLQYCNRLSSLLFALARLAGNIEGLKYEHPKYK